MKRIRVSKGPNSSLIFSKLQQQQQTGGRTNGRMGNEVMSLMNALVAPAHPSAACCHKHTRAREEGLTE